MLKRWDTDPQSYMQALLYLRVGARTRTLSASSPESQHWDRNPQSRLQAITITITIIIIIITVIINMLTIVISYYYCDYY